jgi:hypothetical protein
MLTGPPVDAQRVLLWSLLRDAATCWALMVWLSALQALALLTRSAAGNEKPIAVRSVFEGLEG